MIAYPEKTQNQVERNVRTVPAKENREKTLGLGETIWEAPQDYKGGHYDHFYNFFQAIQGAGKDHSGSCLSDLRAAGAALLANESYYTNKAVNWDPD